MPIEHVVDPDDPRLADYRAIMQPEPRRERGVFIAEGREIVGRLLEAGRFPARSVLLTAPALDALGERFRAHPQLSVYVAPPSTVRAVVGYKFHLGCLAVAERRPEIAPADLIDPPGPRLILALEHLTDPDNVGGIFRNALAFGADAVLLSARCADPLYRKAIRVSVGASLMIPFARVEATRAAVDETAAPVARAVLEATRAAADGTAAPVARAVLEAMRAAADGTAAAVGRAVLDAWADCPGRLSAAGYRLVALTPDATAIKATRAAADQTAAPVARAVLDISALAAERPRAERVALFVGAEGAGLGARTLESADVRVRIPMAPGVDSLNVATAVGIALHRLGRAAT